MNENNSIKRNYSRFNLKDAMQLIPATVFVLWSFDYSLRVASRNLLHNLSNLEAFDLKTSEAAKVLMMDLIFAEIVPSFDNLRIWKEVILSTDSLTGTADYLIAPKRAYLETPLLCVAEAKRDNFERGVAQCITEMVACAQNNEAQERFSDILGIVSNGNTWQFYKLTQSKDIFVSGQFSISELPKLLGALEYIFAECANNVPPSA